MGRETEYEHEEELMVSLADGGCETVVTVRVGLQCTHHSYPGRWNPIDGGQPPEGPEFDFEHLDVGMHVLGCARVWERMTHTQFTIIFGQDIMNALFESACDAAAATGNF